jgi:outer membrane protein assembly factor BamB
MMYFRFVVRRLVAPFLFALPLSAGSADWNQWRGPNRDGVASGFKAPSTWTNASLPKVWTVTVGEGHSSPIVTGDRVFVFAREDGKEVMRCLALKDGAVIWQDAYDVPYSMNLAARGHGKGPKATPVAARGSVYSLGIDGHVSAYDAERGAVRWRTNFSAEFKATSPSFGAAASPLVEGSNLIVPVGGKHGGGLMALDTTTGQVRWKWTGDGPAYASPVVATLGGVRQIVTQMQKHCVAVSPEDGRELWRLPFKTTFEQNSVTPVVAGELIIFGGVYKPTFAVKVTAAGPEIVWENKTFVLYMSTPVLSGTTLFGMATRQRGSLFALDVNTGQELWQGAGRVGENASLTDIGSALLVLSSTGELSVQEKAERGLKTVATFQLSDTPVWASPALAGRDLLVKDKTTLMLYRVGD